jgi:hypothetical protein
MIETFAVGVWVLCFVVGDGMVNGGWAGHVVPPINAYQTEKQCLAAAKKHPGKDWCIKRDKPEDDCTKGW